MPIGNFASATLSTSISAMLSTSATRIFKKTTTKEQGAEPSNLRNNRNVYKHQGAER
jgi:hypothetical protein